MTDIYLDTHVWMRTAMSELSGWRVFNRVALIVETYVFLFVLIHVYNHAHSEKVVEQVVMYNVGMSVWPDYTL